MPQRFDIFLCDEIIDCLDITLGNCLRDHIRGTSLCFSSALARFSVQKRCLPCAFGSLAWTLGILLFPKAFGLPVVSLALPIFGFMIFKAALGPILYRRTMDCPWKDILGASILSVGLAHAIARGVFAGLVKKKGVFVVTPKGWHGGGALAFFNPIREEIGLLVALLMGAATLVAQRGADNLETQLWVGILCLQCIPYVAAILCQVAAYMPERKQVVPACALPGKA